MSEPEPPFSIARHRPDREDAVQAYIEHSQRLRASAASALIRPVALPEPTGDPVDDFIARTQAIRDGAPSPFPTVRKHSRSK